MSSFSVRKIAFGRDHCLLLFSNGQLGAFGDNEGGQLGIDPRANPKMTKNFFCFTPEIPIQDKYEIWDIACGDNYSLVLVGANLSSVLVRFGGIITNNNYSTNPIGMIPNNNGVISSGSTNINNDELIYTDKNTMSDNNVINVVDLDYDNLSNIAKVYAFESRSILITGSNDIYVGGVDFHNNRIDDYILVDHIHNDIKSVGMGLDHVLILDIEGNLYGLGDGVNGQLGPFSPISVDRPMRILSDKFNSRIKKVACGEKHSLILLENGDLYAMGDDHFGQCAGAGDEYGNPIKINFELANKNNYSFVNNSHNSSIYSNNSKSMRSLMSSNSSVSNATNVNKGHPENIIDIYSGYNHCLAVAENRDIYTWGDASYGKLGYSPDDKVINHPLVVNLLKGKNATNIALGKNVSVIITYLYEESLFSMTKTQ